MGCNYLKKNYELFKKIYDIFSILHIFTMFLGSILMIYLFYRHKSLLFLLTFIAIVFYIIFLINQIKERIKKS